ncbi:feruloyl esterase B-2 [Lecanosticta acicola]|uniref:Carboxylic ester hydrolase n=1 Tax=Lecanosticta acicola TaxID=111012 RepID=A0AAI8YRJ1_9PEZI|nr:feruloyl esterase B-2 [Lecanosticta acicola]
MVNARFLSLAALFSALGSTQQLLLQNSSSACSDIFSTFTYPNVTLNFARYIPTGTNLSFEQNSELATCGRASQVVPVDLCRVAMSVATSNRSEITLEAWLPTNWSGRFLATGNGGLDGCIQYEDMAYGTSFGFATVGANNGHNGTSGKAFYRNEDVVIDFAWRSLHTATIVGKALTKAFYQQDYKKSYYIGCSTGGRQGFKMAQDFPDLFDGIVAGAPALAFNNLSSWSGHFLPITGSNTSERFVPPSKWAIVHQDVLRQCDELDGVEDGILEDPALCAYTPVSLQCACNATNTSACLTTPQLQTVSRVLADYYGLRGAIVYPRMQPGAEELAANIEFNGQSFPYTQDWIRYAVLNDPTWDPLTLNASLVAYAAAKNAGNIRTWHGDLSPFKKSGGKLLHYHGQMDQIITSFNSPRYYQHVVASMGQPSAELDSFYRFFRIGGMEHCGGGIGAWSIGQGAVAGASNNVTSDPQYNVLQRIIDWVEKGDSAAPVSLSGVKYVDDDSSKGVDFVRKHCKYPLRNFCKDPKRYKEADAWECIP